MHVWIRIDIQTSSMDTTVLSPRTLSHHAQILGHDATAISEDHTLRTLRAGAVTRGDRFHISLAGLVNAYTR